MEPLPQPPPELKALTPFIQRSNELLRADPIMSYWCTFYAAQQGISAKKQDKESTEMLLKVLDSLETRKAALGQEPAITDDAAGSAYVENFALKIFVGADNEDRAGKATRGTAKKFIAAGNFLDLLKLFGDLKPDIEEKSKYAKWKAGDIAKAFREGRTPVPGPPGGLEAEPAPEVVPVSSKEEDEYIAREMARLMSDAKPAAGETPDATDAGNAGDGGAIAREEHAVALSPDTTDRDAGGYFGTGAAADDAQDKKDRRLSRLAGLSSPNFSKPLQPASPAGSTTDHGPPPALQPSSDVGFSLPSTPSFQPGSIPGQGASGEPGAFASGSTGMERGSSAQSQPGAPALPPPPPAFPRTESSSQQQQPPPPVSIEPVPPSAPLPPPEPSQPPAPSAPPAVPPPHVAPSAPSAPAVPFVPPPVASAPVVPPAPQHYAPVPVPAPAPVLPPPAPLAAALPESLPPMLTASVQKLCKFAASALDYDDLDTARRQLRQALDILEGRATK